MHVKCYHTLLLYDYVDIILYALFVWTDTKTNARTSYILKRKIHITQAIAMPVPMSIWQCCYTMFSSLFCSSSSSSYHYRHHFEAVFISWFGNWFEYTAHSIHVEREGVKMCIYIYIYFVRRQKHAQWSSAALNQWSNSIIHGLVICAQKFQN